MSRREWLQLFNIDTFKGDMSNMSLLVDHLQPMVDKLDSEHKFDGWTIVLTFNYDDSIYKSYSFNSLDYSTNSLAYIISNVENSLQNKYLHDGSFYVGAKYAVGFTKKVRFADNNFGDIKSPIKKISYYQQGLAKELVYLLENYHRSNKKWLNWNSDFVIKNSVGMSWNVTSVTCLTGDNKDKIVLLFKDYYTYDSQVIMPQFTRVYNDHNIEMELKEDQSVVIINHYKTVSDLYQIKPEFPKTYTYVDYGVIDIETFVSAKEGSTIKEHIPYAIGIYNPKLKEVKMFYLTSYNTINKELGIKDMFADVFAYIKDNNIVRLYAHNGGNFDFKLILGFGGIVKEKGKGKWNIDKSFVRKQKIYYMTLGSEDFKVTFYDSFLLLPESLKRLAKSFGCETQKGIFPHSFIHSIAHLEYIGPKPDISHFTDIKEDDYNNIPIENYNLKSECLKYLESDCKALYQVLEKFQIRSETTLKINPLKYLTISKLANTCWRFLDADKVSKAHSIQFRSEIFKHFDAAYYGGIAELYWSTADKGVMYDVNSLYPAIMRNCDFPFGQPVFKQGGVLADYYGICYAKVTTTGKESRGLLPYRFKGMLITPTGDFEGWWYSEELKLAESYGYTIDVKYGYHYFHKGPLFTNFIDTFYKIKSEATDPVQKAIAKLMLNSAYGYLGLKLGKFKSELKWRDNVAESISEISPENTKENWDRNLNSPAFYTDLVKDELSIKVSVDDSPDSKFTNVNSIILSLIITAEARMLMLKFRIRNDTVYTDTDSLHIKGDKAYHDMHVDPKILGAFKFEGTVTDGVYIKKKIYSFINEEGQEVVTAAGLSANVVTHQMLKELYHNNKDVIVQLDKMKKSGNSLIPFRLETKLTNSNNSVIRVFNSENKWVSTLPLNLSTYTDESGESKVKVINPAYRLRIRYVKPSVYATEEEASLNPIPFKGQMLNHRTYSHIINEDGNYKVSGDQIDSLYLPTKDEYFRNLSDSLSKQHREEKDAELLKETIKTLISKTDNIHKHLNNIASNIEDVIAKVYEKEGGSMESYLAELIIETDKKIASIKEAIK